MHDDPFASLDAAYALGALDADDLAAFEAHLRGCAECRERVDDLRPTIGLLAAARADGMTEASLAAGPPPDTLLPGLLRRAERERSRRRWITSAIAGVAAACLVTLVVVLWPSASPARPTPRAFVAVGSVPVVATAELVTRSWGTEIDVRCRYAYDRSRSAGAPPSTTASHVSFGLRVIDRDGLAYNAGTWTSSPDHTVVFTGGTAVRRERIARVQITLPNGTPILQLSM